MAKEGCAGLSQYSCRFMRAPALAGLPDHIVLRWRDGNRLRLTAAPFRDDAARGTRRISSERLRCI
jgi:hypothetical protein